MSNPHNLSPSVFHFEESADVRVIVKEGEPWFVAKDVCDVLGLTNSRVSTQSLDPDEKGVSKVYTPAGGEQEMTIINESGLYALVIRSNKPNARKFRKWITAEVLPAIRKTGRYIGPDTGTKDLKDGKDAGKVAAADVPWFRPEGTYCGVPVMRQTEWARQHGRCNNTVSNATIPNNRVSVTMEEGIDIFRVKNTAAWNADRGNLRSFARVNLITERGARKLYRHFFGPNAAPVPAPVPAAPAAPSASALGISRKRLDALLRIDLPLRCSNAELVHRYTIDECLKNDAALDAIEQLRRAGFNVSEAYTVLVMTREIAARYRDALMNVREIGGVIDQMLGAVGYSNGDEVRMSIYDRSRNRA